MGPLHYLCCRGKNSHITQKSVPSNYIETMHLPDADMKQIFNISFHAFIGASSVWHYHLIEVKRDRCWLFEDRRQPRSLTTCVWLLIYCVSTPLTIVWRSHIVYTSGTCVCIIWGSACELFSVTVFNGSVSPHCLKLKFYNSYWNSFLSLRLIVKLSTIRIVENLQFVCYFQANILCASIILPI